MPEAEHFASLLSADTRSRSPLAQSQPCWQTAMTHDPASLQALLSSTINSHTQPSAAFPPSPGTAGGAHPLQQPGWAVAAQSLQNLHSPLYAPAAGFLPNATHPGSTMTANQLQQWSTNRVSNRQNYNSADHTTANSPQSSSSSSNRPSAYPHPSHLSNTPSPVGSSHSVDSTSRHHAASLQPPRPSLETITSSSTLVPQTRPHPSTSSLTNKSSHRHRQSQESKFKGINFTDLERDLLQPTASTSSREDHRSPAPSSPSLTVGSPTTFSPSHDDIQADDPLATQMWKFFAKAQKSKLPQAARMENLSWRMGGMKLGQMTTDRNASRTPPAASSSSPQSQEEKEENSRGRRQGRGRSKSSTPPAHRAFSPIAEGTETTEMDWRPMSRSRSRARPPVALPYLDTNFGAMPEDPHEGLADASQSAPVIEDPNDFFTSLFGTAPAKDLNASLSSAADPTSPHDEFNQSSLIVDSTNINNWLNPAGSFPPPKPPHQIAHSAGPPLDTDWTRFLHGSDALSSRNQGEASFSGRNASVQGLQHPHTRAENHTADFGFVPKVVRKTSFDAAYSHSVNKADHQPNRQQEQPAHRQDGFVVPVCCFSIACFFRLLTLLPYPQHQQQQKKTPDFGPSPIDLAALGRPAPSTYSRSPSNLSVTLPRENHFPHPLGTSGSTAAPHLAVSSSLSHSIYPAYASLPSTPALSNNNANGFTFGHFNTNPASSFIDPSSLLLPGPSPITPNFAGEDASWGLSPTALSPAPASLPDSKVMPSSPGTVSPAVLNNAPDLNNKMAFSGGPSRSNTTKKTARKSSAGDSAGHNRSQSLSTSQPQGQATTTNSTPTNAEGQLVCSNCSTTVSIHGKHGWVEGRADLHCRRTRRSGEETTRGDLCVTVAGCSGSCTVLTGRYLWRRASSRNATGLGSRTQ